ncbi:transcriptional regulator, TetR family [Piscinibacter sakaiensis]|uniref:Transcriptional regulator, TetR family n=2 Tax=Piscinibacter sakaiensis TaxID=1547922 RepID=A0A0K8P0X3_PISS1|nr:transcriptional regulator, TetR family [Piscinibacter sakaiensis]
MDCLPMPRAPARRPRPAPALDRAPPASAASPALADPAAPAWSDRLPSAQRQRELKEEVLLECAARWFARHGYHGASLADITQELGVTKPAIYHYARSKSELLYRLHQRSLAAAKQARDDAVREGRDGAERLARLVHHFVLQMTASPVNTFLLLEPGTLEPAQAAVITEERRWLERDMRALVQQGIADGSMVACDPKLVTFIVVGAQNWIRSWYRPGAGWSGHQVACGFACMVHRMVAATPALPVPTDLQAWPADVPFPPPAQAPSSASGGAAAEEVAEAGEPAPARAPRRRR